MNAAGLFVQPPQTLRPGVADFPQKIVVDSGNRQNARPRFEHAKLTALMANLQYEYAEFKYTVYRCAAKFVSLQKSFHTSKIPYKLILAVFERHGISDAETNLMVPPFQLTALVRDVYFAAEKLGHFSEERGYQLEQATDLLCNFFWDIFDPHRRYSISFLEIKVTYMLLSKLYSSDQLAAEFFKLLADKRTKCVTKLNFECLLNVFIKILTYIGEGCGYGVHNSEIVMEQCFPRGQIDLALDEHNFHCLWTRSQTRFLIYANLLALIKRIEDTEKLIHSNACTACRAERIIGIRFKCQTCKNLSLCLKCFATGYASNKHEGRHRMYEVFSEDEPPKKFTHYFAKLCNMFFVGSSGGGGGSGSRNHEETMGFCNANETVARIDDTEMITVVSNQSSMASTVSAVESVTASNSPAVKPREEDTSASIAGLSATATTALNTSQRLQSIIDRLLQQNIILERQLQSVKSSTTEEIFEFLGAHQRFLVAIISEMRNFSASQSLSSYPTSSTPNRSTIVADKINNMDNFSVAASNLTHSINGADVNRSYLDANKSDYSLQDLSSWFHQRRMSMPNSKPAPRLSVLVESKTDENATSHFDVDIRETDMTNFKRLLNKVKEIVEDTYSDNTQLSEATQNLENVLDGIIAGEEVRRLST